MTARWMPGAFVLTKILRELAAIRLMQEMDRDVIDLDTGAVRLTGPAALRGLQFWDDLGRVHGIMPHGTDVTADHFDVSFWIRHPGIFFWYFISPGSMTSGQASPAPFRATGPITPLSLGAALAIPASARDAAQSYEALAPLALYIGEHLLLPPVISGQKYIEKPASGYIELMLPEYDRQLALHLLDTARPSPLASSSVMTIQLFEKLTLPLARGEMGLMQAAQQAQNWLEVLLERIICHAKLKPISVEVLVALDDNCIRVRRLYLD